MTARARTEYETAWARLRWLRRTSFRLALAGGVTIVVLARVARPGEGFVGVLFALVVIGWIIAMLALFAERWLFRCPRCGERFHSKFPAGLEVIQRCMKCGIAIGELPVELERDAPG